MRFECRRQEKATHHGVKTAESGTNSKTTEARLGDGSVNDTLVAEAVQKTLGHLVSTVVLGDLLTKDEDLGVGLELLSKSLVERISDGDLLDTGAGALSVRSGLGRAEEDGPGESGAGSGGLGERGSGRSAKNSGRGS